MRTNKRNDEFIKLFTKIDRQGIRLVISGLLEPTHALAAWNRMHDGRGPRSKQTVRQFGMRILKQQPLWQKRAQRALKDRMVAWGTGDGDSQGNTGLLYLTDRGRARLYELGFQRVRQGSTRWVNNKSLAYGQNVLTMKMCFGGRHLVPKATIEAFPRDGVPVDKQHPVLGCSKECYIKYAKKSVAHAKRWLKELDERNQPEHDQWSRDQATEQLRKYKQVLSELEQASE